MTKPVYLIERELEYAKAREAFYKNPNRPIKTSRDPQPRDAAVYFPLFYKTGSIYPPLKLQVSKAALTYFGLGSLGLSQAAVDLSSASRPPRGFKPSLMHAMVGDPTPAVKKAFNGTGRRVIKYSKTTDGSAQAFYQAPISDNTGTPTLAGLNSKIAGIVTAKKGAVGDYGRLWVTIEAFTITE